MMVMMMHRNKLGVINNDLPNTRNDDTVFEVEPKYELKDLIGRGSYGLVCSSINTLTKEEVAIKKIKVRGNSKEALKVLRELRILRHVRHKNVIALKDVLIPSSECKEVYLVFELMETDLASYIHYNQPLPLYKAILFMFQLLNGLDYLHTANIIHRDLKPGNLLLNPLMLELKICDFGLAITTNDSSNTQLPTSENFGTPGYKAPEILLHCSTYGPSVDIWSAGCILAELLGGISLFSAKDRGSQLIKIINVLGTQTDSDLSFITSCELEAYQLVKSLPYTPGIDFKVLFPNTDPKALDLLKKMLQFNPNKRITVAEALQHPFMQNMCIGRKIQAAPLSCHVDVEASVGVHKIRRMIRDEMLQHHHEAAFL